MIKVFVFRHNLFHFQTRKTRYSELLELLFLVLHLSDQLIDLLTEFLGQPAVALALVLQVIVLLEQVLVVGDLGLEFDDLALLLFELVPDVDIETCRFVITEHIDDLSCHKESMRNDAEILEVVENEFQLVHH